MRLYKRGLVWWTDFAVQGTRFRKSLEAGTKGEAKSRANEEIAKAQQGLILANLTDFARLNFGPALDRWLEERESGIGRRKPLAPKTTQTEAERAVIVKRHLGAWPVKKVEAATIHEYIAKRKKEGVSNGTINRELDLIRGVLKKASRWAIMADQVKGLPPGETIGRAFTDDERSRLLAAAKKKPEWQNARLAFSLSLNTSMRPCEIRSLQWRDVDWFEKVIALRVSKTDAGKRTIPLNPAAFAVIVELRDRAKLLFGSDLEPEWYLFYGSEHGGFDSKTGSIARPDPRRPVGHWRRAWTAIMKEAGVTGARFYDSRHTAVTDLLESPDVSEEVAKAIVGHVSRKMLERYSHQRIQAKREAVATLSSPRRRQVNIEEEQEREEQSTRPARN
jgi:integrase